MVVKPPSASAALPLSCHPGTPCTPVIELSAAASWTGDELILSYRLEGDLDALLMPAPKASRRTDGLWQHTCLEAFARPVGTEAYFELNFSPSSEWAVYRFSHYREAMSAVDVHAPLVAVERNGACLRLDATVTITMLSEASELDVGLTAVIEELGGRVSYWALSHPGSKPDFHAARGFVMRLVRGV